MAGEEQHHDYEEELVFRNTKSLDFEEMDDVSHRVVEVLVEVDVETIDNDDSDGGSQCVRAIHS